MQNSWSVIVYINFAQQYRMTSVGGESGLIISLYDARNSQVQSEQFGTSFSEISSPHPGNSESRWSRAVRRKPAETSRLGFLKPELAMYGSFPLADSGSALETPICVLFTVMKN